MNKPVTVLLIMMAMVFGTIMGMRLGNNGLAQINVVSSHSNLSADYKSLQRRYDKLNGLYQEAINDNSDNMKQMTSFFETMFNYDNNTAQSRFNKALSFGSRQAVSVFQVDGDTAKQSIAMLNSRLMSTQYFREIGTENILAIVTSDFTYQEQTSRQTLIYDITLDELGKVKKLVVRNTND